MTMLVAVPVCSVYYIILLVFLSKVIFIKVVFHRTPMFKSTLHVWGVRTPVFSPGPLGDLSRVHSSTMYHWFLAHKAEDFRPRPSPQCRSSVALVST